MTMIERVAQAIYGRYCSWVDNPPYGQRRKRPWDELEQFSKDGFMLIARAAIEAMRKDVAEEDEYCQQCGCPRPLSPAGEAIIFNHHLDAALKEDRE